MVPAQPLTRTTIADMVTGLFAVLARRGTRSLYAGGPRLGDALFATYVRLTELAKEYTLNVRFSAVSGSGEVLQSALALLVRLDMIRYYNGDIELNSGRLALVDLADLPGTPGLYDELASAFLAAYNAHSRV